MRKNNFHVYVHLWNCLEKKSGAALMRDFCCLLGALSPQFICKYSGVLLLTVSISYRHRPRSRHRRMCLLHICDTLCQANGCLKTECESQTRLSTLRKQSWTFFIFRVNKRVCSTFALSPISLFTGCVCHTGFTLSAGAVESLFTQAGA